MKTLAELSSAYGVHTTQIRRWKETALNALTNCFSEVQRIRENNQEELILTLYQQIGQLKVELDWLKKNWVSLSRAKAIGARELTALVDHGGPP